MLNYLNTPLGRLRLLALLEGSSLLLLIFVAVPLKYLADTPALAKSLGPIHGALFILFVFNTLHTSIEQKWAFKKITWKVLTACLIPFGTFYIDYSILRKMAAIKKE